MARAKKKRGPVPKPLPERIDATPEELAKAMFEWPRDHKWKYLEEAKVASDSTLVAGGG